MCVNCPDEPTPPLETEMLAPRCVYPLRQDATTGLEDDDE